MKMPINARLTKPTFRKPYAKKPGLGKPAGKKPGLAGTKKGKPVLAKSIEKKTDSVQMSKEAKLQAPHQSLANSPIIQNFMSAWA